MAEKDVEIYKPGEYLSETKVVEHVKPTDRISNQVALWLTTTPLTTIVALGAGDILTGGIATGVIGAASVIIHASNQEHELKKALNRNGKSATPLPRGLWKSLIPFGHKFFPMEFRVESTVPKADQSKNMALSEDDPRNQRQVSYIVKKGKGGIKVYEVTSPDPMESWDSLFVQETGYTIDRFRPEAAGIYRQLESPNIIDVAAAKVKVALDAGQGRKSPLWLKNLASRPLK